MFILWLWIKEAFTGLFRNMWWSLMAIFLSVSCLLFFSVSYIAGLNVKNFAGAIEQKIEIRVDLLNSVSNYSDLDTKLKAIEGVKTVAYISKDEAMGKVKIEMGKDADILSVLDTNPFPARFVIQVTSPEVLDGVVANIKTMNIAENVQYGEEYVSKMLSMTKIIRNAGILGTALSAIFTVFVVISTIRINIVQRRNEIRVKQLIGAGMATIRFPFVLEALMLTCLSGAIVYGIFYFGYGKVIELAKSTIPYVPMVDTSVVTASLMGPLAALSIAIGFVGSFLSVRKFVKRY